MTPPSLAANLARRLVGPTMERAPEVCRIAEAERQRDVFVGQIRVAEILQGKLGAQFIPQAAKRKALLAELASQRTLADPEKFRRFLRRLRARSACTV